MTSDVREVAGRRIRVTDGGEVCLADDDELIGAAVQSVLDGEDTCWIAEARTPSGDPAKADPWEVLAGPLVARNGYPAFATEAEALEAVVRRWRS